MSVYPKTLLQVNGSQGITEDGIVTFTGNRKFYAGDIIWTDGQYAYGLQHRASVNIPVDDSQKAIPILAKKVGYYVRSLDWTDYELKNGDGIVNDETQYFTLNGQYADAEVIEAQGEKGSGQGGFAAISANGGPYLMKYYQMPKVNINDFYFAWRETFSIGNDSTTTDSVQHITNCFHLTDQNDNQQNYTLDNQMQVINICTYSYAKYFSNGAPYLRKTIFIHAEDAKDSTGHKFVIDTSSTEPQQTQEIELKIRDSLGEQSFPELNNLVSYQKYLDEMLKYMNEATQKSRTKIDSEAEPFSLFANRNNATKNCIDSLKISPLLKKIYSDKSWKIILEIVITGSIGYYINVDGYYTTESEYFDSNDRLVYTDDAGIETRLFDRNYKNVSKAHKRYGLYYDSPIYVILLSVDSDGKYTELYKKLELKFPAYRYIRPKCTQYEAPTKSAGSTQIGIYVPSAGSILDWPYYKQMPFIPCIDYAWQQKGSVIYAFDPETWGTGVENRVYNLTKFGPNDSSIVTTNVKLDKFLDESIYVPEQTYLSKHYSQDFRIEMQDGFYIKYIWQGSKRNLSLKQKLYSPKNELILTLDKEVLDSDENIHFANFAVTETQADESGKMVYLLLNQTSGKLYSVKDGKATKLMENCKNFRLRFMQDIGLAQD